MFDNIISLLPSDVCSKDITQSMRSDATAERLYISVFSKRTGNVARNMVLYPCSVYGELLYLSESVDLIRKSNIVINALDGDRVRLEPAYRQRSSNRAIYRVLNLDSLTLGTPPHKVSVLDDWRSLGMIPIKLPLRFYLGDSSGFAVRGLRYGWPCVVVFRSKDELDWLKSKLVRYDYTVLCKSRGRLRTFRRGDLCFDLSEEIGDGYRL